MESARSGMQAGGSSGLQTPRTTGMKAVGSGMEAAVDQMKQRESRDDLTEAIQMFDVNDLSASQTVPFDLFPKSPLLEGGFEEALRDDNPEEFPNLSVDTKNDIIGANGNNGVNELAKEQVLQDLQDSEIMMPSQLQISQFESPPVVDDAKSTYTKSSKATFRQKLNRFVGSKKHRHANEIESFHADSTTLPIQNTKKANKLKLKKRARRKTVKKGDEECHFCLLSDHEEQPNNKTNRPQQQHGDNHLPPLPTSSTLRRKKDIKKVDNVYGNLSNNTSRSSQISGVSSLTSQSGTTASISTCSPTST